MVRRLLKAALIVWIARKVARRTARREVRAR